MRLVHSKGIAKNQRARSKAVVAEVDVKFSRGSRLAVKVLVFRNPTELRKFWKKVFGGTQGRCVGTVHSLMTEWRNKNGDAIEVEADPNYFAVIGLCQTDLRMEVICHEAMHAGFAYAKRAKRDIFGQAKFFDEEAVCYPAGRIAAAINRFLHDKRLYLDKG